MAKKYALVLSGGGFNGAFQVGVLEHLYKYGIADAQGNRVIPRFEIVAGVSVGALNGSMVAADKFDDLKEIWFERMKTSGRKLIFTSDFIQEDGGIDIGAIAAYLIQDVNFLDVVSLPFQRLKKSKGIKKIKNRLANLSSLADNRPLKHTLSGILKAGDIQKTSNKFFNGFVSLQDGEYYAYDVTDFATHEDFIKSVWASTTIPIIWNPVDKITVKTKNGTKDFLNNVDGGIRTMTPLGVVVDEINKRDSRDDYEIVIITCGSGNLSSFNPPQQNILDIGKRGVLDITLDEIFDTDISQFMQVNRLVDQAGSVGTTLKDRNENPYKSFTTHLIKPEKDLGDSLDTRNQSLENRRKHGNDVAKKYFG